MIYGCIFKTCINNITIAQHISIRSIFKLIKESNIYTIYTKYNILKCCALVNLNLVQIIFRATYNILPQTLQCTFKLYNYICNNSSTILKYGIQLYKLDIKKYSKLLQCKLLWNNLAGEITMLTY